MIGKTPIWLKKVDSTNLYLHHLLLNTNIEEGTLIVAEEQTSGRGQRENRWESQSGMNLTFSFIVYPDFLAVADQFMLSKFVALSLFDLLMEFKLDVKIKWPNDIYVGSKKIAGILIENVIKGTKISSSIIGVGLNINQYQFGEELLSATSLYLETGKKYNLESILLNLTEKLMQRYLELKMEEYDKLDNDYLNSMYQFGEYHDYRSKGEIFKAKIIGIENDGRLCLHTKKNEILKFAFKEVEFL